MLFTVREGFVVHLVSTRKLTDGSLQPVERSFYPGDEFELSADEAESHKHKLVPLDKEATKYLNQSAVQSVEVGVPLDQVNDLIQKAVAEALAKQQAPVQTTTPAVSVAAKV